MKNPLKYPLYKDSEVEWLHEIPTHWKIVKAKRIFHETSIKNRPNEPLLAATQTKGVIPKSLYENTTVTATKNFETLKFVRRGDFVISLRSFQGGIEYAHYQGIISPAYTILEPQEEVVHNYYRYLLKSKHYISGLTLLVTGIREGQNIDTGKFKDSFLPLPTKEEQIKIASFLDFKLKKIDRFIRKKKQLIKLLNEQKAGIINHAVTKGLDTKTKMKPSGIEWLGNIPEHWEVRKLKYVADFQSGEMITSETISETGEYAVYGGGGFRGFTNSYTNEGQYVLIGRQGALCGNIKYAEGKFWASEHAIVTYPKIEIEPFFIGEIMNVANLGRLSQTAAQPGISIGQIKHVKIPIPSLTEQLQIVTYIKTETAIINSAISKIEKEIALTQEYKIVLIAEAVTGKIDVRDVEIPKTLEVEIYDELEEELSMVAEDESEYETTSDL